MSSEIHMFLIKVEFNCSQFKKFRKIRPRITGFLLYDDLKFNEYQGKNLQTITKMGKDVIIYKNFS